MLTTATTTASTATTAKPATATGKQQPQAKATSASIQRCPHRPLPSLPPACCWVSSGRGRISPGWYLALAGWVVWRGAGGDGLLRLFCVRIVVNGVHRRGFLFIAVESCPNSGIFFVDFCLRWVGRGPVGSLARKATHQETCTAGPSSAARLFACCHPVLAGDWEEVRCCASPQLCTLFREASGAFWVCKVVQRRVDITEDI